MRAIAPLTWEMTTDMSGCPRSFPAYHEASPVRRKRRRDIPPSRLPVNGVQSIPVCAGALADLDPEEAAGVSGVPEHSGLETPFRQHTSCFWPAELLTAGPMA